MIPSQSLLPAALLLCCSLFAQKGPIELPQPDIGALTRADEVSSGIRFAGPIALDWTPADVGEWTSNNGINGRWAASFSLAATNGLALFLDQVQLPNGGQLWLRNAAGEQGPFTNEDRSTAGRIFTGFLPGTSVELVYEGPVFGPERIPFHIWRADHVYRPDLYQPTKSILDFGASNACQINANCPDGDGWADEKSGAARVIIVVAEGTGYCSGNLVNNTAEDGRPLFLTGFHCQDGFTPLYDLWRFDFGYRSADCNDPVSEPNFTAYQGAFERAGRQESDFLLLEIADVDFDASTHYFAGWDRSDGAVNSNTIAFHHPMGDIQKVSRRDNGTMSIISGPITWNSGVITPGLHHFRMEYTAGTFEVGSSGSAVFDEQRRIRGQLNGGNPSCPGTTVAFIGRLFQSWTGGGTAESRLSDWLDPLGLEPVTFDGAQLQGNTAGRTLRGIASWQGQPLDSVRLILNWGDQTDTVYTDERGEYSVPRPDGAAGVSIATFYEDEQGDELQGVNVLDIVALRRHLLGLDTLTQVQLVGADVNNTGSGSIADIVRISRVILNLEPWGDRPNWIVFPTALPLDPLPVNAFGPFNITLTNPDAGVISLDFSVLKNGDVNLDAY